MDVNFIENQPYFSHTYLQGENRYEDKDNPYVLPLLIESLPDLDSDFSFKSPITFKSLPIQEPPINLPFPKLILSLFFQRWTCHLKTKGSHLHSRST